MAGLSTNNGDPDQALCFAVSDLSLHCLFIYLFWGSQTKNRFKVLDFSYNVRTYKSVDVY